MTRLTLPITVALFSLTMLDRALKPTYTSSPELAAAWVARGGSADQLTWLGFGLGVLAALSIAFQQPLLVWPLFAITTVRWPRWCGCPPDATVRAGCVFGHHARLFVLRSDSVGFCGCRSCAKRARRSCFYSRVSWEQVAASWHLQPWLRRPA